MEHSYFITEAFWVILTYGVKYTACGFAISTLMVLWGSFRKRLGWRIASIGAATVVLWFAMFIAVESGYRAWQSIPNPPDDAYSDTGGPFFILFLGWLPSLVILGTEHFLLRLFRRKPNSNEKDTALL